MALQRAILRQNKASPARAFHVLRMRFIPPAIRALGQPGSEAIHPEHPYDPEKQIEAFKRSKHESQNTKPQTTKKQKQTSEEWHCLIWGLAYHVRPQPATAREIWLMHLHLAGHGQGRTFTMKELLLN